MSTIADHYQILGVARNATSSDIKKAYRKLALKYHPDKNKQAGAEDLFKRLSESYAVLSDPTRKMEYDVKLKSQGYNNSTFTDFSTTTTPYPTYSTYSTPAYDFDAYRQSYQGYKQQTQSRAEEARRRKEEFEEKAKQKTKGRAYQRTYGWHNTGAKYHYYNFYNDGNDSYSKYEHTGTKNFSMNNNSFERNKPKTTQKEKKPASSPDPTPAAKTSSNFGDPKPDIKNTNDGSWSKSKHSYSFKSGEKTYTGRTPFMKPPLQKNTYSGNKQENFTDKDLEPENKPEPENKYKSTENENKDYFENESNYENSSGNDNDDDNDGDDKATYFEESSFKGSFGQSNSSADESDGLEGVDNSRKSQDDTTDNNLDEDSKDPETKPKQFSPFKEEQTNSNWNSMFSGGLGTEKNPIELESGSEKTPPYYRKPSPLRRSKRKPWMESYRSRYHGTPLASPRKPFVKPEKVSPATKPTSYPDKSTELKNEPFNQAEPDIFGSKRRKTESSNNSKNSEKLNGLNNMQDLDEELPSSTTFEDYQKTEIPSTKAQSPQIIEEPEIIDLSVDEDPILQNNQQQKDNQHPFQEPKQFDSFNFDNIFNTSPFTETRGNFNMDSIKDFISEKFYPKSYSSPVKDDGEMDLEENENENESEIEFIHKSSVNTDQSEIPIHKPINQPLPRRKKARREILRETLGVTDSIMNKIIMKAPKFIQFEGFESLELKIVKYKEFMMEAVEFDLVMMEYFKIRSEKNKYYLKNILQNGSEGDKKIYLEVAEIDGEVMSKWNEFKKYQQSILEFIK